MMVKKKTGSLGSINGYGNEFQGSIAGTKIHCKLLGKGPSRKLRCKEMAPGPGQMSKAARKRAGVKAAKKESATVPVAKSKAIRQGGKAKGTPLKGCRRKSGKVLCTPTVAKRLKAKKSPKKRAAAKKRPTKRKRASKPKYSGYGAAVALTENKRRAAKKRRR
jgi:histone H1/5